MDETIFKAYDVRGIYPTQLNEQVVYDIVQAYVEVVKPKRVVVARDVREHGQKLLDSVIVSYTDAGVDVIDIGLVSTEMMYWAVVKFGVDGGVTVSASHNSREWNGLNFTVKNAIPISSETGLLEIKKIAMRGTKFISPNKGNVEKRIILDEFCKFILSLVDLSQLKQIKLVANANCGYQGVILKRIVEIGNLPIKIFPIFCEPDGSFPVPESHPNPLILENRKATIDLVIKHSTDLGVSWDADGDRCFIVDDRGRFIEGYFTTAVLAKQQLAKHHGGKVVIDPRLTWASIDTIKENGGEVVVSRAGMTIIPSRMRKEQAIFAGEMSGHYYFPETFYRDSGMLSLFRILELMCKSQSKLSDIYDPLLEKYRISGEINNKVASISQVLEKVERIYSDGNIEHIDGLSVDYSDWRFNLRGSNTEPLLRLNVESYSQKLMEQKRDELLSIIRN